MMDYHAIHGHDIASFDTTGTTHRLPTVNASQALDELSSGSTAHISTGLDALDKALLTSDLVGLQGNSRHGGIKRGQVTEIWGPPGSGKTAVGIQLAANALRDGNGVVWVDCFQDLRIDRTLNVLNHVNASQSADGVEGQVAGDLAKFVHYSCMTLPHLIALISRPTANSIAQDTSLVVISSLSAHINASLLRSQFKKTSSKLSKGPNPATKRLQGLQFIINALQKLAATRNCAVVLLSQCATRMQSEHGATLVPAVNAKVWENGVSTRLVLFRDWAWSTDKSSSVFLAGLQKVDGIAAQDAIEHISAFRVERTGISSVHYEATHATMREVAPIARRPKRKLGQTELEVPDSEDDEDYGWAEDDENALPPPPSQWQGSEDLILGPDVGSSEGDEQDEPVDEEDRYSDEVGVEDRGNNEPEQ